jgi:hypothetical protein
MGRQYISEKDTLWILSEGRWENQPFYYDIYQMGMGGGDVHAVNIKTHLIIATLKLNSFEDAPSKTWRRLEFKDLTTGWLHYMSISEFQRITKEGLFQNLNGFPIISGVFAFKKTSGAISIIHKSSL